MMERGDLVRAKLDNPRHATVGMVLDAPPDDLVLIGMIGNDDPRKPLPSGSVWCFLQRIDPRKYEIIRKAVP